MLLLRISYHRTAEPAERIAAASPDKSAKMRFMIGRPTPFEEILSLR
jgi:hypothetical protein